MLTANESVMSERGADAEQAAAPRAADHQADAEQRDRHRDRRPTRDRLAERDPGEQRRGDRRYGLQEEDVRDRRVIQRDDEEAGGERRADGDSKAGEPHRAERRDRASAVPDRDEGRQRDEGEEGTPRELRRRVDRELSLQPARGRPGHRGRSDVQLPPPSGAQCDWRSALILPGFSSPMGSKTGLIDRCRASRRRARARAPALDQTDAVLAGADAAARERVDDQLLDELVGERRSAGRRDRS